MKKTTGKSTPRTPRATRAKPADTQRWILRLYVAGMAPCSERAIANVKEICEEYLQGRYDLQVIDLYQQPALAEGEQIVALPTLIVKLPAPLRRLIGDFSNREQVLIGLHLIPKPSVEALYRDR